jgi:signal transduction histidine kinase
LVKVGQTINATLNLDQALKVITREACVLMGAKVCLLHMLDESQELLDLRASYSAGPAHVFKPRLSAAESLAGIVIRRRKPLQAQNVHISGRYHQVEIARLEGLVSVLSVPLAYGRQAIGALSVYTGQPHRFSNEEIHILSALAELSALAIERTRLYERLVDMEEQMRQSEKLSALGLLAAEVAHEIRNPLTVMKMLFHSLNLQFPAGDPRAQDARIIGDKLDHLNKIMEHVLDFARGSESQMTRLNVNQVIEDLSLLLRHKLAQHNVQLNLQLAPALPPVLGNAAQLGQAFLNLALNALEAMPEGGRLTILTRPLRLAPTQAKSPGVLVEFKDTGLGMTADQQAQLFTSLLSSTKRKGAGLGLAIVAKVIEAHQGHIKVRSRLGKGTTFRIQFKSPSPEGAAGGAGFCHHYLG